VSPRRAGRTRDCGARPALSVRCASTAAGERNTSGLLPDDRPDHRRPSHTERAGRPTRQPDLEVHARMSEWSVPLGHTGAKPRHWHRHPNAEREPVGRVHGIWRVLPAASLCRATLSPRRACSLQDRRDRNSDGRRQRGGSRHCSQRQISQPLAPQPDPVRSGARPRCRKLLRNSAAACPLVPRVINDSRH
jgi:hypothetical protein